MSKEGKIRGVVNFTTLFIVFIVFFGVISLLMNNIAYILLAIFGLALGLLIKGGDVNAIIRIVLLISSIGAVAYSSVSSFGNLFAILGLAFGVVPITYLPWWFLANVLPLLLPFLIGFFAAILSLGDRKPQVQNE